MSKIEQVAGTAPSAAAEARWGARVALTLLAALGPLAMAGWALTTPYLAGGDKAAAIAAIQAEPSATAWGLVFLLVAGAAGAAGSVAVGAVVRRGSPRLGTVAMALSFTGFCIAAYPGPVGAIAAANQSELGADQVLALVDVVDAQPAGALASALFVCLPAGILLLGVAALLASRRGHGRPLPAVVLTAAMPLVMVGGFLSGAALAAGWVMVAAGFALVAAEGRRGHGAAGPAVG